MTPETSIAWEEKAKECEAKIQYMELWDDTAFLTGFKQAIELYESALKERIDKRSPHDGAGAMMSVDEIKQILSTTKPIK